MKDYLMFNYKTIASNNLQTLINISKIIGNFKMIQIEHDLKKLYTANNIFNPTEFYKIFQNYLINQILTDKEISRVKALDKTKTDFLYKVGYKKKVFKNNYI
jgi:hypothetical protein